MGVALFIVPEREIDGFDPFVNGKALGRARDLDRLAEKAGVPPLMAFFGQSSADVASLLGEDEADLPPSDETWFPADDGLATVRGLARYLETNPSATRDADALLDDLREFEAVLGRLAGEGVRWHLSVDL